MREPDGVTRTAFRDTYLALVLSQHRSKLPMVVGILLLLPVMHAVSCAKTWMEGRAKQDRVTAPLTVAMVADPQQLARVQALEAALAKLEAERRLPPPTVTARSRAPLATPVSPPAPAWPSIPDGTAITVVLAETIATNRNVQGDTFQGELSEDIAAGGRLLIRARSNVRGRILELKEGSREEPTVLVLRLESIAGAKGSIQVSTEPLVITGRRPSRLKRILKGAAGAIGGAIVGKREGGSKGALVGGAVGATISMRGNAVVLPASALIEFRVRGSAQTALRVDGGASPDPTQPRVPQ